MEKENKPRVCLTEWAPFIRNEYQRQVNPEMTGDGTTPKKVIDDPEGSAESHKRYVRELFRNYVAAFGMADQEECFKGGIDKAGRAISNNTYSFWEEDKELVIELLNIEKNRKGGLISDGNFKDCVIDDLGEIIDKLAYLFAKYDPSLKEDYVKHNMSRTSGYGIRAEMGNIAKKIGFLLLEVCLKEVRSKEERGGMSYEDFLYWTQKMMEEMDGTIEKFIRIYNKIQERRMIEFNNNMIEFHRNITVEELVELNNIIDDINKNNAKLGVKSDISDIPLISNKKDVKGARNMKKIKQNFSAPMDSKVYRDYIYQRYCNRQPIEEVLNYILEDNNSDNEAQN